MQRYCKDLCGIVKSYTVLTNLCSLWSHRSSEQSHYASPTPKHAVTYTQTHASTMHWHHLYCTCTHTVYILIRVITFGCNLAFGLSWKVSKLMSVWLHTPFCHSANYRLYKKSDRPQVLPNVHIIYTIYTHSFYPKTVISTACAAYCCCFNMLYDSQPCINVNIIMVFFSLMFLCSSSPLNTVSLTHPSDPS